MKDKKNFYIARIEEKKEFKQGTIRVEEKKTKFEKFASSYSGYNNQDKMVFPYVKYDNNGRQYEDLKDKKYRREENSEYREIPSYLRRDEPVITKRNIEDLKGVKLSKEEIERRNRENYLAYSSTTIEKRAPLQEEPRIEVEDFRASEENNYASYEASEVKSEYQDRDRTKHSTLVVTPKNYSRDDEKVHTNLDTVWSPVGNTDAVFNKKDTSLYQEAPEIKHAKSTSYKKDKKYKFPSTNLLDVPPKRTNDNFAENNIQKMTIDSTLEEFKVGGHVEKYTRGPTVTQFEVKLDPGVKPEKVENIYKTIKMNLAAESLRIEAPIIGKTAVGIEVPNNSREIVYFSELIRDRDFLEDGKPLNVVLGKLVDGRNKYLNIVDMPHVLVGGSTGSGKTVCLHTILASILFKASPDEIKLLLIDPKRNELLYFREMPHLVAPIITDPDLASSALEWVVEEMERRFMLFESTFKGSIIAYNDAIDKGLPGQKLPYILIVIDEFGDLMCTTNGTFEMSVQRIAQKARSAGIHMIIATQRPTTDVVKGTIKANFQGRIAFKVNQQVDSMTILDHAGAEKLLKKGDMLLNYGAEDIRVQNAFISPNEIERVTDKIREENPTNYIIDLDDLRHKVETSPSFSDDPRNDELFERIAKYVVAFQKASANQIQRAFGVGFNRVDTILEGLERLGVVSSAVQGRSRDVLIESEEELQRLLDKTRF